MGYMDLIYYLAIMADEKEKLSGSDTTDQTQEETSGGKSFTQEELDKIVQKRLAETKERFEKELKSTIAKEREEAERLAKLSAEEKEKELTSKQREEITQKERELAIRENKLNAIDKLVELGIPVKLVDFVVSDDATRTEEGINKLNEAWKEAISQSVADKLKGSSPKDFNVNSKKEVTKVVTAF